MTKSPIERPIGMCLTWDPWLWSLCSFETQKGLKFLTSEFPMPQYPDAFPDFLLCSRRLKPYATLAKLDGWRVTMWWSNDSRSPPFYRLLLFSPGHEIFNSPYFLGWSNDRCSLLSLHTIFQDLEEFPVLKGLDLCLPFLYKLSALSLACVLHDVVPLELSCSFAL